MVKLAVYFRDDKWQISAQTKYGQQNDKKEDQREHYEMDD